MTLKRLDNAPFGVLNSLYASERGVIFLYTEIQI